MSSAGLEDSFAVLPAARWSSKSRGSKAAGEAFLRKHTSRNLVNSKNETCRWWPVVHPENTYRQIWQAVMALPLAYTGTIMPYLLCFVESRVEDVPENDEADSLGGLRIVGRIVDALFCCDLILQFFFAYYSDVTGMLVTDPRKIAKNYMKGWFFFDLIACLPGEFFTMVLGMGGGVNKITRLPRLYRILRIVRLIRLLRMSQLTRLFKNMQNNEVYQYVQRTLGHSRLVSVAKFMLLLFCLAHILGCAWYLVAAFSEDPEAFTWLGRRNLIGESDFTNWLNSVYFILAVFTTVGFGDIHPVSTSEVAFGMMVMLIGAIVNSVIVSNVIAIITRVDGIHSEMRQKRQAIVCYGKQVGLKGSRYLSRIETFSEYATRRKYANRNPDKKRFDWKLIWEVIREMPPEMRLYLRTRAFNGALDRNFFFKITRSDAENEASLLLATTFLSWVAFERGNLVWRYGEQASGLYLISIGVLSHVAVPTDSGGVADFSLFLGQKADSFCGEELNEILAPYHSNGHGGYVGEWELVIPQPRVSSCRAEAQTECLFLPQHAFIVLVSSFPQTLDSIKRLARRREGRRRNKLFAHKRRLKVEEFAALQIQGHVRGIQTRKLQGKAHVKAAAVVVNSTLRMSRPNEEHLTAEELQALGEGSAVTMDAASKENIVAEAEQLLAEGLGQDQGVWNSTVASSSSTTGPGSNSPSTSVDTQAPNSADGLTQQPSADGVLGGAAAASSAAGTQRDILGKEFHQGLTHLTSKVDELYRCQDEMRRMMQQLYFLNFSSKRDSLPTSFGSAN